MIDSHCHLADRKFRRDLPTVLSRASGAGVTHAITIADTMKESRECVDLAKKYDQIFCTVGVHPHSADEWEAESERRLREMAHVSKNIVAIGEIGLDYHYDNSPRDVQRDVFRRQLILAKELGLPAVIHNRESIADMKAIIREVDPPSLVVHCCTEKWEDVEDLVAKGYFLSFTGIATYPASNEIRYTMKQCPLNQMMIETDAPYLAPLPHRGKRNEPAYVVEVARCIARVKGMEPDDVGKRTTENTVAFFSLPL